MCGRWEKRAMVLLFRVVTLLYLRKMRYEIQATDVPFFNNNKKQTAEKTLFCSSSTCSVCCITAAAKHLTKSYAVLSTNSYYKSYLHSKQHECSLCSVQ